LDFLILKIFSREIIFFLGGLLGAIVANTLRGSARVCVGLFDTGQTEKKLFILMSTLMEAV
jgi:hypothetical protein